MTTATLTKAETIEIEETSNPNVLKAHSGTKQDVSYSVTHNGVYCTHCACPSYGPCSHIVAGDLYLARKRAGRIPTYCCYCGKLSRSEMCYSCSN